jgi:DNA adenine methylase
MNKERVRFLRYPGGKQRLLSQIVEYLPSKTEIKGRYVEPFVGGGAVFFLIAPEMAVLSDINSDLLDLYRGIRKSPAKVWDIFRNFPSTKKAYYRVRDSNVEKWDITKRSARVLYLNRTCFKGMWRHNQSGRFNVGYGGQDRRWVVSKESLIEVSRLLRNAVLKRSDFEKIIDSCKKGDFIFLDPPYRPGDKELINSHYFVNQFSFEDHQRLAVTLARASKKGVKWAMTTSSHKEIVRLFRETSVRVVKLKQGTGDRPGKLTKQSGEVLICNY